MAKPCLDSCVVLLFLVLYYFCFIWGAWCLFFDFFLFASFFLGGGRECLFFLVCLFFLGGDLVCRLLRTSPQAKLVLFVLQEHIGKLAPSFGGQLGCPLKPSEQTMDYVLSLVAYGRCRRTNSIQPKPSGLQHITCMLGSSSYLRSPCVRRTPSAKQRMLVVVRKKKSSWLERRSFLWKGNLSRLRFPEYWAFSVCFAPLSKLFCLCLPETPSTHETPKKVDIWKNAVSEETSVFSKRPKKRQKRLHRYGKPTCKTSKSAEWHDLQHPNVHWKEQHIKPG